MNHNNVKEQLRIPLTKEEIDQLSNGDHVQVILSDVSPHGDIVLYEDNKQAQPIEGEEE